MILVDTSMWIDWLRYQLRDNEFQTLPIAYCGVVRAELLHGCKSIPQAESVEKILQNFREVPIPEKLWTTIGRNLMTLRWNGIQIALGDAVIATLAIEEQIPLWTKDNHFSQMQKILPHLQLFQPTP